MFLRYGHIVLCENHKTYTGHTVAQALNAFTAASLA